MLSQAGFTILARGQFGRVEFIYRDQMDKLDWIAFTIASFSDVLVRTLINLPSCAYIMREYVHRLVVVVVHN